MMVRVYIDDSISIISRNPAIANGSRVILALLPAPSRLSDGPTYACLAKRIT